MSEGKAKLHVYFLPTADGVSDFMVAAPNQRTACERLNCAVGYFRRYGGRRVTDETLVRIAMSEPERVWKQKRSWTQETFPWVFA